MVKRRKTKLLIALEVRCGDKVETLELYQDYIQRITSKGKATKPVTQEIKLRNGEALAVMAKGKYIDLQGNVWETDHPGAPDGSMW